MDYRDYFKGKKITLMGLGLLGRGVGDAAFLAKCGANVLVTDKKTVAELASSVWKLKKYPNIRFALGGHKGKDFRNADMVLKAAGVPLDSSYIKEARKNKIPVSMSTALFVKLLPPGVTVIGVTGTRGKTTTTHLIYEILNTRYPIPDTKNPEVFLGGNIQGISTLALLPKVKSGDFVVLELDSWQLQGFRDLKISPQVAVFTTFFPDHMNYYGGDMKKYFADKAGIFRYQKSKETKKQRSKNNFVVGEQVAPFVKKWEPKHARRAVVARTGDFPKNWKLKILGEHNHYNAACALALVDALGVPRSVTKKAVENFRGVPGRLELVRELRGVKIYNDTTATTPDATIAALRALGEATKQRSNEAKKQNIILIMGGADKGLKMNALVHEIPKYCKAVVFLSGTGTDKFLISNFQFLNKFKIQNSKFKIHEAKTLKEAVKKSYAVARKEDIILFSPSFASFGMFKNEYDRGEKFNHIVWTLG